METPHEVDSDEEIHTMVDNDKESKEITSKMNTETSSQDLRKSTPLHKSVDRQEENINNEEIYALMGALGISSQPNGENETMSITDNTSTWTEMTETTIESSQMRNESKHSSNTQKISSHMKSLYEKPNEKETVNKNVKKEPWVIKPLPSGQSSPPPVSTKKAYKNQGLHGFKKEILNQEKSENIDESVDKTFHRETWVAKPLLAGKSSLPGSTKKVHKKKTQGFQKEEEKPFLMNQEKSVYTNESMEHNPKTQPWVIRPLRSSQSPLTTPVSTTKKSDKKKKANELKSSESKSHHMDADEAIPVGRRQLKQTLSSCDIVTYNADDTSVDEYDECFYESDTETEFESSISSKSLIRPCHYTSIPKFAHVNISVEEKSDVSTNNGDSNKLDLNDFRRIDAESTISTRRRRGVVNTLFHRLLMICGIPLFSLFMAGTFIMIQKQTSENKVVDKPRIDMKDLLPPTHDPNNATEISRIEGIFLKLNELLGNGAFSDIETAQYRAVKWIISEDEREVPADDPHLVQRYALAVFYFATTIGENGQFQTWKLCDGASTGESSICDTGSTYHRFLSSNNECNWYGVSCNSAGFVSTINIGKNDLHGTIPNDIFLLSSLTHLLLPRNKLYGTIPPSIGDLVQLRHLNLSHNKIIGQIPTQLSQLSQMNSMNLSNNRLNSSIPHSIFVPSLTNIDFGSNTFTGTIPKTIYDIADLEFIDLSFNKLTGTLNPEWGTAFNLLKRLRLEGNQLVGTIPEFWVRKDVLREFNVGANNLTGTIPVSVLRSPSLEMFHVGVNQFSGTISSKFHQMAEMKQLILWSNKFTGKIPSKLSQLRNLEILHLSFNLFSGDMPEEICSLRNESLIALSSDCDNEAKVQMNCDCCTYCSFGNYDES